MSTNACISIIIPVYNGEKYFKKTIDSCLAQTGGYDIEIIVIDDCSSDSSRELIKGYGDAIVCIFNEINLGITKTCNKAASLAKGEYLMILGQDDLLPPNHIEAMCSEFDENTSFVHCNANVIDEEDQFIRLARIDCDQATKSNNSLYELAKDNFISSTGFLLRKSYFDRVGGYDERFKNYGEWLLWIKLALIGRVKYSTKVRSFYRRHQTNITNTFKNPDVMEGLLVYQRECQKFALKQQESFLKSICIISNIYFFRIKKWLKCTLKKWLKRLRLL